MRVESFLNIAGDQMVRITCENAYSPWALTLKETRELYTKLTYALEQIARDEQETE